MFRTAGAGEAAAQDGVDAAMHLIATAIEVVGVAVIVVGALLAVAVRLAPALGEGPVWARIMGFLALILASINIFGGFLVTQRMLAMYRRKD